mmetsp:Transcript_2192/g.4880  ORF Transcript_2192/g.4880 Transcript_2192/m.4880 type:complete len:354 (-) Transcript_2192:64-1125(-)|eukprot:CAMPEP_0197890888 /NCGR_PEP_ID=MMETSP1439-20131203/27259_1 /TAXON_ID=66791 /ORGANISM="Gonyaulax spinifera, Strain CCMP409" /LENGTH=353 /DNA_ID=CAMNT_0043510951 /DNA_START=58 /DNA_END=1119 /DNA_ORIENTATION=+
MSFPLPRIPKHRDADFEVGEIYGRGTFTSVYQATEKATGKSFAMKIVDRYRCDRLKKTKDLWMEKHCLQRVNHPNIIKMLGWFSDTLCVYVVMEECTGGELWDVVKTVGCPNDRARHYLAQVICAVEYLRQARIVHRDLKCENLMLTDVGVVKLIDFGTAKDLENPHIKGSGNQSRHKVFEDYVGTPQFMPHEVIENKCSDARSDTWSLGCTAFQVLIGCPPFHAASEYLIFTRVIDMDLVLPPGLHPQARDLITRMVVKDQDARLGAHDLEEVKLHPFFEGTCFEDAHLHSQPVLSLADLCLQKVGRQLKGFQEQLDGWNGHESLKPEVKEVLERMQFAQKWQDDALPPDAE